MGHACHTPSVPATLHPSSRSLMKRPNPATARSWSARHHRRLPGRPSTWAPLSPNDALVDRCLLLLALQAGHVLGQVIDGQYPRKLHVLDLAVAVAVDEVEEGVDLLDCAVAADLLGVEVLVLEDVERVEHLHDLVARERAAAVGVDFLEGVRDGLGGDYQALTHHALRRLHLGDRHASDHHLRRLGLACARHAAWRERRQVLALEHLDELVRVDGTVAVAVDEVEQALDCLVRHAAQVDVLRVRLRARLREARRLGEKVADLVAVQHARAVLVY
mmetsp:Transcript_18158/g.47906  ORF Transcript_18158/g.47906 Transcript_18158/m.47906 type:complete len:275 (+) Transcript_18158:215-1039(+)